MFWVMWVCDFVAILVFLLATLFAHCSTPHFPSSAFSLANACSIETFGTFVSVFEILHHR